MWFSKYSEIAMTLRKAFGKVFAKARRSVKLTQESFEPNSPRTYISHLERGLSSPTLDKLDELSNVMGIHAVSILFHAYLNSDEHLTAIDLMAKVMEDVKKIDRPIEITTNI